MPPNERASGRCATSAGEGECQSYELRRKRQAVKYQEARLVVSSSRRAIRKDSRPLDFFPGSHEFTPFATALSYVAPQSGFWTASAQLEDLDSQSEYVT